MKKGINIWSFPNDMDLSSCMQLAKTAGFDGIEPALAESGPLSLESKKEEILAIRQEASDLGLEITSLASGLGWTNGLTSSSRTVREKASDIVKRQLETAALLGADTILVVPGAVGVDFMEGIEVTEYEEAYENAVNELRELAKSAEAHQVSIGVENVWNKFLLSPLEMKRFIDEVGSTYVGAYLDVGNTVLNGYPEHWVRTLGSRIKKVHFKDFRRQAAGLSGFVDLLAGDVDYPAVMEALRNIGYEGYAIAEMIPPYRHHSQQIIYNTSASMDAILGRR
ncbi:sugar phosphate isomerase/epimerase family protein [Cohnella soli]|uniref:Sugar phosphate isomerase/epimerase family protein n=1 Tax=Cohnella soli TaxID=425005 RepID=A0ABW0HX10_9BACL